MNDINEKELIKYIEEKVRRAGFVPTEEVIATVFDKLEEEYGWRRDG